MSWNTMRDGGTAAYLLTLGEMSYSQIPSTFTALYYECISCMSLEGKEVKHLDMFNLPLNR